MGGGTKESSEAHRSDSLLHKGAKGKRPYIKQDEEQVVTPKAVLCPLHVCDGTHISVFILSNACVTHTHTQNTKFKKMIYRLILHNFKV